MDGLVLLVGGRPVVVGVMIKLVLESLTLLQWLKCRLSICQKMYSFINAIMCAHPQNTI